ncbi:hypothetical protein JG688_00012393 [Phytophthora aleatoria]|uniref:Tc1-like transposase DDE domain-containing protein n=1 Tax=Phytophthora aleatoria TaxID=2496075 RepID=A0A8J5IQ25_9STRA|nr:hypothetical protein JG688_00012393 [Phytophthora aleatoria]
MMRKRGYAVRGKKVVIRGDFERKPRVDLDRVEFTRCCQDVVHATESKVCQYPGPNSVWVMDGATIHRHPEIIHYPRSVGIVPIFLPAYCPFYNPIKFLFGYIKRSFQRHYSERSRRSLMPFVVQTFSRFKVSSILLGRFQVKIGI